MPLRSTRSTLESVDDESAVMRLSARLASRPGTVLLGSSMKDPIRGRYSFLAADPFLTFSSKGSHCEWQTPQGSWSQFGNPWRVLESQLQRYEVLDEIDLPFPVGGCFGFCGYGLRYFVEPKLPRKSVPERSLPDCWFGFYDSLLVCDHELHKTWIIATGLDLEGARSAEACARQTDKWRRWLSEYSVEAIVNSRQSDNPTQEASRRGSPPLEIRSNLTRAQFVESVLNAKRLIQSGDIYQVNLSHRLHTRQKGSAWSLYEALSTSAPAPYAAFINTGPAQIVSSSPELFLRLSGDHVLTRPIKGTRPRSNDTTLDAQLTYDLQTSPKEMAELVMITDLLRNDLGRVCQYGTVQVPELVRLERFSHVQHLVSTIEGRLRPDHTHFSALASMFPGGSITGAPKFRAMEIIDELESHDRGAYTGTAGYIGFNRESQMNILIRTAICAEGELSFPVGAGIVADSNPEAEYEETWAKARGFLAALHSGPRVESRNQPNSIIHDSLSERSVSIGRRGQNSHL